MFANFTVTTLERLETWKQSGIISEAQHGLLSGLFTKRRFSLFLELNALLYLGVLSLPVGLGWTFSTHFEKLGDMRRRSQRLVLKVDRELLGNLKLDESCISNPKAEI